MTASRARRAAPLLLASVVLLASATAAHAAGATRTWVSGVGDDVNPCSRTAPCKTFAGAISKTADGGEINVLDPGGFGSVTITHAITIDGGPVHGGVLNSLVNGIVINAAATDDVVLRNLDIEGGAAASGTCAYAGVNGVWVRNAGTVRIESTTISSQATGVKIAPEASDPQVSLAGVSVNKACLGGIQAAPAAGRTAAVSVAGASVTNAGIGIRAGDGAHVWLSDTTVFGNATGLLAEGSGIIETVGGNHVYGNTTDGAPTKVSDAPVPGPPGVKGDKGDKGDPAFKLVLAPATASLRSTTGRRVALSYAATMRAKLTLTITKGKRRIATVRSNAKAGRNTVAGYGRKGRRAAAPGRYRLKLRAVSANGQAATTSVALRIVKRVR
jgi:hypothetical protein